MPSRRDKGASILPRAARQRKIRGTPEGQGLLGKLLIVDFRLLIEKQRLIATHKYLYNSVGFSSSNQQAQNQQFPSGGSGGRR
jgi:hypothetical protein